MSFLYHLLLKRLYPTSLCLLLLATAVIVRKRKVGCRVCFSWVLAVLVVRGNGWVVGALAKHLEWQYPALQDYRTTGLRDHRTTGPQDYRTTGLRGNGSTGQRDYGWEKQKPESRNEIRGRTTSEAKQE